MPSLHSLCHNPRHISGSSSSPFWSLQCFYHHFCFSWIWNTFLPSFSFIFLCWKICLLTCSSWRWSYSILLHIFFSLGSSSLTFVLLAIFLAGDGVPSGFPVPSCSCTRLLILLPGDGVPPSNPTSCCCSLETFVRLLLLFPGDGVSTTFPTSSNYSPDSFFLLLPLVPFDGVATTFPMSSRCSSSMLSVFFVIHVTGAIANVQYKIMRPAW